MCTGGILGQLSLKAHKTEENTPRLSKESSVMNSSRFLLVGLGFELRALCLQSNE
jgi:hypothetical protein